jgi:hypothetical protein
LLNPTSANDYKDYIRTIAFKEAQFLGESVTFLTSMWEDDMQFIFVDLLAAVYQYRYQSDMLRFGQEKETKYLVTQNEIIALYWEISAREVLYVSGQVNPPIKTKRDIAKAITRFSLDLTLKNEIRKLSESMQKYKEEFEDYFKDLSKSEIRTNALHSIFELILRNVE